MMNFLNGFFLFGTIPASAMYGTYDYRIVLLSIIVQIFASYVMIAMGLRLRYSSDSYGYKLFWLLGGAFAIGAGTGAMHFLGGLGYTLPMPMPGGMEIIYITYSFLVGIAGSVFALAVVENKKISKVGLAIAGIIFGLSIVFMHYISMEAMKEDMIIFNRPDYFIASVLAGILAGEAAIWLTIACHFSHGIRQMIIKLLSALIIAFANIAQHYIAMAGAIFIPRPSHDGVSHGVVIHDPTVLAAICAIITLLIMGMALILLTYRQLMTSALQRKNEALESAFANLQKVQKQLIQSEKMASLGQLIAGISHEINTPAGAISAAIGLVKNDYTSLFKQHILLMKTLPADLSERYLLICDDISNLNKALPSSTESIRKYAKEIEDTLIQNHIPNAHRISRNLAAVGASKEMINDVMPLLITPQADLVQDSLFKYGMSQIHIRDMGLAIERIVLLIKALRLYSHASKGQLKLADIREQIESALIILNNKLKKGIEVEKHFENIEKINCYAEPLNQVWINLINNSIESLQGKGKIILRVTQDKEKKQIMFSVEDNGPGIPFDILPRIFDPYFTTKEAGTGLGLSIVKDIINKNHGDIIVDTCPGKTIVKIILPTDLRNEETS